MWLSERFTSQTRENYAAVGEVTIGGGCAAETDREQRGLALCSPGGYFWKPAPGRQVVVLKCGDDGNAVMGVLDSDASELSAGEVCIQSNSASITLRNDGTINVSGRLIVNGNEIV